MLKKTIFVLLGFVFLFSFNPVQGKVVINEVKLHPAEERFIELYNEDNSSVDLATWYIQRKTETGSSFGSLVSKTYFENKKINANGYFLISRSAMENADIILSTLTLTESNIIQIKNQEGEIVDKMCWGGAKDCEIIAPNPPSSQSIQRGNGSFFVGTPSPKENNSQADTQPDTPSNNGTINNTGSVNNDINTSASPQIQTENVSETKAKTNEPQKIKAKIIANNFVFSKIPVELNATARGYNGEILSYGKYFWNFGDGDSREANVSEGGKITHVFTYPGEYSVTLEYYQNYYSTIPDAYDKINIKAIKADISISNVGDEKDFFIEISNNMNYDADLSRWIISSKEKSFSLPKNTLIQAKKKMVLSPQITNFNISDKNTLKIATPQGETLYEYSVFIEPTKTLAVIPPTSQEPKNKIIKSVSLEENKNNKSSANNSQKPSLENLSATALNSDTEPKSNLMFEIGLIIFLGASAGAAYFIRSRNRENAKEKNGEDFEIMDE